MDKSFVSSRARGIGQTLLRQINDLADTSSLNLGLGEPSFPTPEPFRELVKRHIDEWHLGYSPNPGLPELRQAIAEKSEIPVTPDQICVTVGSEEALFVSLMVTIDPGDEVLVPDPGFPSYAAVTEFLGGIAKPYPLRAENGFCLRTADVKGLLSGKTKAVIVNSPNNPSGAVYSESELTRLAAVLEEKGILAISDEVYKEIHYGERPDSIARHMTGCIRIDSLSKRFSMTGWRLGWAVFPEIITKPFVGIHQMAVICAPVLSQKIALEALLGAVDSHASRYLCELRRRRDLAVRCLKRHTDLSFIQPSGAFYLLIDVRKKRSRYGDSLKLALDLLKEEKVVTIPGIAFGKGGEGFLRLSYAASPEVIEEGILRISRFLASRRDSEGRPA